MGARTSPNRSESVRVRLIRKIACQVDGVDISSHAVGEVFDLPASEAGLLVAEGWAVVEPQADGYAVPAFAAPARTGQREPHDGGDALARTLQRLRELRAGIEQRRCAGEYEPRRAEDIYREELHDSRAKTVRVARS